MLSQRQLFLNHIAQTSDAPLALEIISANGCLLKDASGKSYLDLISGIAVSNLGHGNIEINNAIKKQVDNYLHIMVYGEFIETPQVQLAQLLTQHLPETLSNVYFTNSGSEAVEGALKLAKRLSGKTEIISFKNSYHGSTMGALSLGNNEERKNSFRPLIPDNRILEYNNFDQIQNITEKTAAVIIEPVQAEAGIIIPEKNYLQAIRNQCDETNTLLIFDECQTGMGRTGKLFAFEKYEVIPDIICLGKAFGGGMPLGAFISSKQNMSSFISNPILGHLSTFGGHPVCCAAGFTSLSILLSEKEIIEEVKQKEALFLRLLKHEKILSIRSSGLMMALEFESTEFHFALQKKLLENGLFTDWFLFAPHCMRIAPALTITEEEIKFASKIIIDTINTLL